MRRRKAEVVKQNEAKMLNLFNAWRVLGASREAHDGAH